MNLCDSLEIKKVSNGYIVKSKCKSTYVIEEHIFEIFADAVEFAMKYFYEIETWDKLDQIVIKKHKSSPTIVNDSSAA